MLKELLFWYSVGFLTCMAHVTFTNLKCSTTNKTLFDYKYCHIKAVNRTHKYMTFHGKLYIKNLTSGVLNIQLKRNTNQGYKPFFIDLTFDVCKFLKNRNNVFINLFYTHLRQASNINHTCPYDEDLIVDKLWSGDLEGDFLKYLPLQNGDYAIYLTGYAFNYKLVTVEIYMKLTS